MKKRLCAACGAEVEPACPACHATLTPLPTKPRDLGLLLNVLTYRVPIEAPITGAWIEKARKHCRMPPERLAELQAILAEFDPSGRFEWRLEIYVLRNGSDFITQVIDLKTGKPIAKPRELSENVRQETYA